MRQIFVSVRHALLALVVSTACAPVGSALPSASVEEGVSELAATGEAVYVVFRAGPTGEWRRGLPDHRATFLQRIDVATGAVTARAAEPAVGLVGTAGGRRLFRILGNAFEGFEGVEALDGVTLARVGRLTVRGGMHGLAVSPDGSHVFRDRSEDDLWPVVLQVDAATG